MLMGLRFRQDHVVKDNIRMINRSKETRYELSFLGTKVKPLVSPTFDGEHVIIQNQNRLNRILHINKQRCIISK